MKRSILLATLLSALSLGAAVRAQFQLNDPFFPDDDLLSLEVLESGETAEIRRGEVIAVELPFDSVWNICVRGQKSSDPEALELLERCYEIKADVADSGSFEASLDSLDLATHFQPSQSLERVAQVLESREEIADSSSEEQLSSLLSKTELQSEEVVERSTRLQKVQVRVKKRPQRALGQSVVSAKSIKRMPNLGEADVVKAIQAMPGVVASSDFSSKIYVRGGSSDQNLFLFDNGVVFSPVHFFGLFSTFLVEGVDRVEFYKGGFPPRYGNRLSSVVDVQSRLGGDPDSLEWFHKSSIKVSSFSTQAHTEGHQGNWRWILAGRVTYLKETLDLLRALELTDLDLNYRFFDLQGNLTWAPDLNRSLMFSWYVGEDKLDFDPFIVSWGNKVLPVNFQWPLNDDTELKMSYAYSEFNQTFGLSGFVEMINDNSNQMFKPSLLHTLNRQLLIEAGVEVQNIVAHFAMTQEQASLAVDDGGDLWLFSPFSQARWTPEKWEITAGLRANISTEASEVTAEPRFSVRREIGEKQKIDFHIGHYYQYLNSIILGDMENLNEFYFPSQRGERNDIPPSRSILFSLGYTRSKLPLGMVGIVEGYYKTLDDLLILDGFSVSDTVQYDLNSKISDFIQRGEGYSYGAEFSLRREEGTIFGGVSYSWGEAILKDTREVVYANWDRAHSLKADLSINWKGEEGIWKNSDPRKKWYFRSSSQVGWNSGLPYTEVIGYVPRHELDRGESISSRPFQTVQGGRNERRYPYYFRWDIKPVDVGVEGKWNFSWTILNITDRRNIFLYAYDQNQTPPKRLEIPQFPFFPIFMSYEYFF